VGNAERGTVNTSVEAVPAAKCGFSGLQVLGLVVFAILLSAGLTYWWVRTYLYASDFKPVALSSAEQVALDGKLRQVGLDPQALMPGAERPTDPVDKDGRLIPERYTEDAAKRNIRLNERELNAMVASDADFAKRFAIDLSDNLASAKVLIPVDPDMPIFGGKTLRVSTGLELNFQNDQPVVILRGVSIMGVPIPNAWLGNLKNVDLIKQFGTDPGFWQGFAAGIKSVAIKEDELRIELKE
jgi:hypothetical protein